MEKKFWKSIFVLGALLMGGMAVGELRAQTYATLSGYVVDPSGAAIPGVALKLENEATGAVRTLSSGDAGEYAFTLMPPARYTLTAAKSGFSTALVKGVVLDVNADVRHDITLVLGSVEQQLTVQANAVQVNTESAALGEVVGSHEMIQLPLNGRDFLQLAELSAGVSNPPTTTGQSTASGSLGGGRQTEVVIVSGTREVSEIVMFDGVPEKQFFYGLVALQPPVDSIAEFKIQEGYFSPQFYSPAIVNVAMKSGTNSVHGAAWEFVRNDILNARNYFDINRAPFKQNQFGANAGGPLIKNKVFWFGDYEGLRLNNYSTSYLIEPTPAELTGNFSALLPTTQIYDPATWNPVTQTRQPFPGNIIPTNRISTFASPYNQFIPAPNTAPIASLGGANLDGTVLKLQRDTKWDVRVDADWSTANRFFGRASRIVSSADTGSLSPASAQIAPLTGENIVFGWTHIFTSTIVNDFRAGLDRAFLVSGTPANASGPNFPKLLGLANVGGIPICNGVATVSLAGYAQQGAGSNCVDNGNSDKLFIDNLNVVHGKHTISLGFEIRRVNWHLINSYKLEGSFNFTGGYSGNAVANYLLGDPTSVTGAQGSQPTYRRAFWPSVYVNDDFHVTSKLTLNYGVSWIYTPPPGEKYDNIFGFDFKQDAAVRCGTQLNGVEMPPGCFARQWLDFAPRFGIVYAPAKDWSVRASYGVFWDRIPGNEWVWSSIYYPFQSSYSATSDPNIPTINISQLFPAAAPPGGTPPAGTSVFDIGPPNRKDPNIQQWTASVQHTLPGNVFLQLAYVGSKGTHLSKRVDANLDPSPPSTPAEQAESVNQRRPYQPFGFILSDQARGNSMYNALQFTARKPMGHGLSFLSGFTYSKSLDDDSYDGKSTRNYRPGDMDKGPSTFNMKYRFTTGAVYDLPIGRSATGALRQVIAGWRLNAIITSQTGVPFEVYTIQDYSNTGASWGPRPNRVCDGNLPRRLRTRLEWFNTSCFVNPAQNTYGNGGVGYLNTPGIDGLDLGLSKDFRLAERVALQFRAEAFNSLNNVNFNEPGGTVGTSTFGMIGSAAAPRQVQFALKLLF